MADSPRRSTAARGLVGGLTEEKATRSRHPAISHPLFLAPLTSPDDEGLLTAFAAGGNLAVEIGFGKGHFLASLATQRPDLSVVGFEVKRKLCVTALERLECVGAGNARIMLGDARDLMDRYFPPGAMDMLFILFPDPWWKKKHHKRRLWTESFVDQAAGLLGPSGLVVVRSDVPMVLELADDALLAGGQFARVDSPGFPLPQTDRERVCARLGIPFEETCYRRS